MSTESRGALPGELTCITENCANAGAPVGVTVCPRCYRPTFAVPTNGTGPAPLMGQPRPSLSAGDVLSRTIFGGFWAVVSFFALITSGVDVSDGKIGPGLLALVGAVLGGLYARYIFRGGRFRMLFW